MSAAPFKIVQVTKIPGFVAQMHRSACDGKADKYLSRSAVFVIGESDRMLFQELEDVEEVYLLYTLSGRGKK